MYSDLCYVIVPSEPYLKHVIFPIRLNYYSRYPFCPLFQNRLEFALSVLRNAMEERKGMLEPYVVPDKIIYLIHAYRASQALFTACDLGIFDILHTSSSPLSAQAMSQNMSSNPDATTRLLDSLVSLELLEKTEKGDLWLYNNTTIANRFLTKSSRESLVDFITLNNKIEYPMFGNLASAIREGTPQWMKTFGRSSQELWKEQYGSEEACLRFTSAMHGSSQHGCDAVAKAFDLTAYTKCCDLGG